jgi:folate-binding protein YgfZ
MAITSPLKRTHQEAEASIAAYGPPITVEGEAQPVEIVETYGDLELEYAALRKHCIVLDQPYRGVVEVTGPDRLEFLNRMLTQELKDLSPFAMKRSFWLNRKGRIDADLRVIDLPHATYLEMDVHAVARTVETLATFVVMEDVSIRNVNAAVHRFGVHGPTAGELLQALSLSPQGAEASGPVVRDLEPGRVAAVRVNNAECIVARDDTTGEVGLELIVPIAAAREIYEQMLEVGVRREGDGKTLRDMLAHRIGLRPAGWHAYNMARIEAGQPLYNLDFGMESLPAETGLMHDRVSLKKGCYLGQEVVARMHARNQAKQRLVGIVFEAIRDDIGIPLQPATGMAVMRGHGGDAPSTTDATASAPDPIGVITSSTVSPMLGAFPIAFAALKGSGGSSGGGEIPQDVHCTVGTTIVRGRVQDGLAFWKRPAV